MTSYSESVPSDQSGNECCIKRAEPGMSNLITKCQRKYPSLSVTKKNDWMTKDLSKNEELLRRVVHPYDYIEKEYITRREGEVRCPFYNNTCNRQPTEPLTTSKTKLPDNEHPRRRVKFNETNLACIIAENTHIKDLTIAMQETADILCEVTKSSGAVLYFVDEHIGTITIIPKYNAMREVQERTSNIFEAHTISAAAAIKKEYVTTDNIANDSRFPKGVGWIGPTVQSVLCVPIVTVEGRCLAVTELYRDQCNPYELYELQISVAVTGWMGAAIHQNRKRIHMQEQIKLNDFLLRVTKRYLGNRITIQKFASEIIMHAKILLSAKHGSFYIFNKESDEITAECYVEGVEWHCPLLQKRKLNVRFDPVKDIIGIVARTGTPINIKDASIDHRFLEDSHKSTTYVTKSLLCVPIKRGHDVLGAIQIVNHRNESHFSHEDEAKLAKFQVYSSIALNFARLVKKFKNNIKQNEIYIDMLHFHMAPTEQEVVEFHCLKLTELPENFKEFEWYITPEYRDYMPQLVQYMLMDMIGAYFPDLNKLTHFILTTKKSYRGNPYHNYEHAFNVAHCMYVMLKKNLDAFNDIEILGLLVGAHCHDLNHPGYTNNFLQLTKHPLVQLYDESPLENHHIHVTMMILEQSGIFDYFDSNEFIHLSKQLYDIIIASDLAVYFRCRAKLLQVVTDGFDWKNVMHRTLLKSIMMTAADLAGQSKPYRINKRITQSLYREFYNQGDREKKLGINPLSLMDRTKQNMIIEDQIQFINIICMPCSDLLYRILPTTHDMLELLINLLSCWNDLLEMKRRRIMKEEQLEDQKDITRKLTTKSVVI